MRLDAISTRQPHPGVPVVRLDRCPGAIVRNCRAFAGTDRFLSVGPGELKELVLEGNALGSATRPAEESELAQPTHEPATEDGTHR